MSAFYKEIEQLTIEGEKDKKRMRKIEIE